MKSSPCLLFLFTTAALSFRPSAYSDHIWAVDYEGRRFVGYAYDDAAEIFSPQRINSISVTGEGPNGLVFNQAGEAFVSINGTDIIKFSRSGIASVFGVNGGRLSSPHAMAFDRDGNLFVANYGDAANFLSGTIVKINGEGVSTLFAVVERPRGLAFDRDGNLYVSTTNNTIVKITPAGVRSTFLSGGGLNEPWGLAFDAAGNLYVSNYGNNTITRITPAGVASLFSNAGLNGPAGLAFDSRGNLYVANTDRFSGRGSIARLSLTGTGLPTFVAGTFNVPISIAITDNGGTPLSLPPAATPPPPPPPPPDPGRITNMSIRSSAGTGAQTLIVGAVLGGAGTSGTKPLLIRGIGPALTGFGVPGALADPALSVFAGANVVASNDNWGGDAQVTSIGNALGAFGLTPATSRDAALYAPALAPRDYTIQVTGAGGATGVALAEIYDATPAGAFTATTPQLVNVSARTQVGTGADILIAGFTLGGTTPRTVLIRAVGPTLTGFGVTGALADPQLALFSGSTQLQQNNDWGAAANAAQITSTTTALATFQLGAGSRDSAILTTLQPGSYTAQISGVAGTTGVALVEIYVVP